MDHRPMADQIPSRVLMTANVPMLDSDGKCHVVSGRIVADHGTVENRSHTINQINPPYAASSRIEWKSCKQGRRPQVWLSKGFYLL
jgi:hypothetical protein